MRGGGSAKHRSSPNDVVSTKAGQLQVRRWHSHSVTRRRELEGEERDRLAQCRRLRQGSLTEVPAEGGTGDPPSKRRDDLLVPLARLRSALRVLDDGVARRRFSGDLPLLPEHPHLRRQVECFREANVHYSKRVKKAIDAIPAAGAEAAGVGMTAPAP
jgi:hypothetical protein